jgi:hypothetical protein
MNPLLLVTLEKYGFLEFEKSLDFLAEVYVVTHRAATAQQAVGDLSIALKALFASKFGAIIDVAWDYLLPSITARLQAGIDAASKAGLEPGAGAPA